MRSDQDSVTHPVLQNRLQSLFGGNLQAWPGDDYHLPTRAVWHTVGCNLFFRSLHFELIFCGFCTQGLKVAVIEGADVGGTCVNRGCVPSKALLAAAGRVRDFKNTSHLKSLGIQLGAVSFDRQGISDHASNLVATLAGNLKRSLETIGVVGVNICS